MFLGMVETYVPQSEIKISLAKGVLLDWVLIILLGFLGMYLFFVKGVYGLYCLFNPFTWENFWGNLIFRLIVILFSYKLVQGVDTIQTAYKGMLSISSRPTASAPQIEFAELYSMNERVAIVVLLSGIVDMMNSKVRKNIVMLKKS